MCFIDIKVSYSFKNVIIIQGATNGVCHVHTYAKETNSLPDVHGNIYCSTLAYTLLVFPVYANKISYHMTYTTIFLKCTSNDNKKLNMSL